eukprot:Skav235118  [mRNA]  locus=scaffold3581:190553:191148:+ [translate_table: standard]
MHRTTPLQLHQSCPQKAQLQEHWRDRSDYAAKGCIHGIPVSTRSHTIWPADAPNGLVMCFCCLFEKLGIGGCPHFDHLVNCFQRLQGLKLARGLEENSIVPIHFLGKRVGSISKLLCSIANLISKSRRSHHHAGCCCGHWSSVPRPRHKIQVLLDTAGNSHRNSDSNSFPCSTHHGHRKLKVGRSCYKNCH